MIIPFILENERRWNLKALSVVIILRQITLYVSLTRASVQNAQRSRWNNIF